jgi:hypothetical protein
MYSKIIHDLISSNRELLYHDDLKMLTPHSFEYSIKKIISTKKLNDLKHAIFLPNNIVCHLILFNDFLLITEKEKLIRKHFNFFSY